MINAPSNPVARVRGLDLFRNVVVILGVGGFAAIYLVILYKIVWTDDKININLTYVAAAVGGVLASHFIFALGVDAGGAGRHLTDRGATLATAAFWIYAIVGILTVAVASFWFDETPEAVKGTAAVFAGYLTTVFAGTFSQKTGFIPDRYQSPS